jgi:hypothetical protein
MVTYAYLWSLSDFMDELSEMLRTDDKASVRTKAACRYDVGQRGKHSLQLLHSFIAISGMKHISFFEPLSIKPTAFNCFTSAQ